MTEPTGILFNIQRFSTEDGPGIRTTVFFKGCPLTCPWCHNPEGMEREAQTVWQASLCMGCGASGAGVAWTRVRVGPWS